MAAGGRNRRVGIVYHIDADGFYTYADNETGDRAEFRYTFESHSYFNGLLFALYAFYFAILIVLPIFAAAEGGAQLTSESAGGTIQLLLARPISRSRIFATKLVTAVIYIAILAGVFLAVTLIVGLVAVGWGDLNIYPVVNSLDKPPALFSFRSTSRFNSHPDRSG